MLISYLGSVSAGVALGWVVAIILAIIVIYKYIEKYRAARNKYDDTQKQAEKNASEIKVIKEDFNEMKESSDKRFEKLEHRDVEILDKLDNMSNFMTEMHDYQKKRDVHDLKDRIEKGYRNFLKRADVNNGKVFITENELEVFNGLIESYEEAGGNSFVHTEIKPDMAHWEVVSIDEMIKKMGGAS